MSNLYWLSDDEWSRIEPLLRRGRRGAHRVDDHRVISGIVHMLRSGGRWRDCPAEYGPYTTIYNRFNRWSRQGVWYEIFEALTGSTGMIGTVAIDSSHIKAHRSAAGGKGGVQRGHWPIERRAYHQNPCPDGRPRPAAGPGAHARQHGRCHGCAGSDRGGRMLLPAACRQGL